MLKTAIIIAIIAIICCGISTILGIVFKKPGQAILFAILTALNVVILIDDIHKYNALQNGELETTVVKNVVGFSADTITVINGADTTRTYTLTYWKDYE